MDGRVLHKNRKIPISALTHSTEDYADCYGRCEQAFRYCSEICDCAKVVVEPQQICIKNVFCQLINCPGCCEPPVSSDMRILVLHTARPLVHNTPYVM